MGSCSGKEKIRERIKSELNSKNINTPDSRILPITRKNFKQKAAVVDSRLPNLVYSEVPNASTQDTPKTEQEIRLIINSLKKHFIFSNLKSEYTSIIVNHMIHYFLNTSEIVFEQNQPGNNFYVVSSGKLEVIINDKQVSHLVPGDSFGEMALIHDTPRTATVKTVEKSSL